MNKKLESLVWHNEQRRVKDLIPWEFNPRQMTEKQAKELRESLEKFNVVETPAIDIDDKLVGGHQRIKILIILGRGDEMIDVRVPNRKLTEEEFRELNLRLNRNLGEWDLDMLANFDEELLKNVGWEQEELNDIFQLDLGGGGPSEGDDDVPDPPAEPKSKYGDLYQLGRHRLLCGDATKREDVERLMGGEKADCILTDPPYGINQKGIPNDEPEKLDNLIKKSVFILPVKNTIIIAFQSTRTFPVWLDAIRNNGHKFERMLWLYKEAQCTFPWRGWILKSESILISSFGSPNWNEIKPYSHDCYKLSEVSNELSKEIGWHGSIKPQKVIQDILLRCSIEDNLVFDPFGGSGSTLVAAEKTNRRCFMMEIEPLYIDVILQRWETFTGKKAVKL